MISAEVVDPPVVHPEDRAVTCAVSFLRFEIGRSDSLCFFRRTRRVASSIAMHSSAMRSSKTSCTMRLSIGADVRALARSTISTSLAVQDCEPRPGRGSC